MPAARGLEYEPVVAIQPLHGGSIHAGSYRRYWAIFFGCIERRISGGRGRGRGRARTRDRVVEGAEGAHWGRIGTARGRWWAAEEGERIEDVLFPSALHLSGVSSLRP
jgi:hypothetical protein